MSTNVKSKQVQTMPRQRQRQVSAVFPTEREVLLARLLLHVIDVLGQREDLDAELYDGVKAIAEPVVREAKRAVR